MSNASRHANPHAGLSLPGETIHTEGSGYDLASKLDSLYTTNEINRIANRNGIYFDQISRKKDRIKHLIERDPELARRLAGR